MTKFLLHLKHPLVTLIIIGLLLRFVFIFVAYSWDVNSHITWGKEVIERGIHGFYERPTIDHFNTIYPNYPPLSIYVFVLCYEFYTFCKFLLWQLNILFPLFPSAIVTWFDSREAIAGFMKIPSIVADIGVALLLYKMVVKYKNNHLDGLYAVVFYLFNPFVWYTSALWGQIESISLFFVVLSYYVLLYGEKKYMPFIIFTFALLFKQTSFVFLPILTIAYLKKNSVQDFLVSIVLCLIIFCLAFIPFYTQGNILLYPFITYFTRILTASGIPFASNHAFNFWALITQWKDIPDSTKGWGLSYRYWGYVCSIFLLLPIFWKYTKRALSSKSLYFTSLVTAFTVYLFFTRMHERHIQQALLFLIPFAVVDKRLRVLYIVLSFIHMVNLYHNWSAIRWEPLLAIILSAFTVNTLIVSLIAIYGYIMFLYMRKALWLQKKDTV